MRKLMEKNIKEQKPSNEANSRRRAGELLIPAAKAALEGKQYQPLILAY